MFTHTPAPKMALCFCNFCDKVQNTFFFVHDFHGRILSYDLIDKVNLSYFANKNLLYLSNNSNFQPVPTDIEIFTWLPSLLAVMKTSVTADLNVTLQSAVFEFENLNEENWIFHACSGMCFCEVVLFAGFRVRDLSESLDICLGSLWAYNVTVMCSYAS